MTDQTSENTGEQGFLQALGASRLEAMDIMNQLNTAFVEEDSVEIIDLTSQVDTEQSNEVMENSQFNNLLDGIDFAHSLTPTCVEENNPIFVPSTYPENEEEEITCIPSTYPEEDGYKPSQDLFTDQDKQIDECSFSQLLGYVEDNTNSTTTSENIVGETLPFNCVEQNPPTDDILVENNMEGNAVEVIAIQPVTASLNDGEENQPDSDEGIVVDNNELEDVAHPVLQPFSCEEEKSPRNVDIYEVSISCIIFPHIVFLFKNICLFFKYTKK